MQTAIEAGLLPLQVWRNLLHQLPPARGAPVRLRPPRPGTEKALGEQPTSDRRQGQQDLGLGFG